MSSTQGAGPGGGRLTAQYLVEQYIVASELAGTGPAWFDCSHYYQIVQLTTCSADSLSANFCKAEILRFRSILPVER